MSHEYHIPNVGFNNYPLAKFSFAEDPPHVSELTWDHVYQDLHVIFDNYGSAQAEGSNRPAVVMKVIQGAKVLELVNLVEKIQETKDMQARAIAAQIPLQLTQCPTYARHRRSSLTIALCYQLPNHKARRLQLRFVSGADYEATFSIFKDMGCPSAEAGPAQSRLSTAVGGLETTKHQLRSSGSRPSSSSSFHFATEGANRGVGSQLYHGPIRPSTPPLASNFAPFDTNVFDPKVLPSPHFLVGVHDDRLDTAITKQCQPPQQVHRSFSSTHTASACKITADRPSMPLFPTQEIPTTNSDQSVEKVADEWASRPQTPLLTRPSDQTISTWPVLPMSSSSFAPERPDLIPRHSTSSPNVLNSSRPPGTSALSKLAQLEDDLSAMNQMSAMIPPRRQLPFERPPSKPRPPSREGSSSRPSSSLVDLPPLPVPTFTTNSNLSEMRPPTGSKTNAQQNKPKARKRPDTALGSTLTLPTTKRPASAKAAIRPSTAVPKGSVSLLASSPPRASSAAAHNGQAVSNGEIVHFSSDATITSSSTITQPGHLPALQSALSSINKSFQDYAPPRSIENSKEILANYASLKYDERLSIIEEMIISNISDDNFTTLCEDVYGCWQRIGAVL